MPRRSGRTSTPAQRKLSAHTSADFDDDDSDDDDWLLPNARAQALGRERSRVPPRMLLHCNRGTSLVVGGGATPLLPRAVVTRVAASAWPAVQRSHSLPPLLTALFPRSGARRAEAASDGLPPGQARRQARARAFKRVPPRALPH